MIKFAVVHNQWKSTTVTRKLLENMSFRGKDRGSVYEDFTKIVETTWPSPKTSDGGCALDLIGTLTKRRENLVVGMGGSDSKLNFRKAVVQLTTKKTVRQNVMIRFATNLFKFSIASSEYCRLHLINCLVSGRELSTLILFLGCWSNRWHVLGAILVRVIGEYKWCLYFNSWLRNKIFARRKSVKFGNTML